MVSRVYLDACVYIYYMEAHPQYSPIVRPYFDRAERGQIEVVASPLILQEVMTGFYQDQEDPRVAEIYNLLITHPAISWADYTVEVADTGAKIRAGYKLKTPDTIHLATAILHRCDRFVTNDRGMISAAKRLPLEFVVL